MKGKNFDVQTIMKLIVPKEVGVTLVPLDSMEKIESTKFWEQMFFGIFTALLGSFISLVTTDFNNLPVIYLIGIFGVIFFLCFMAFAIQEKREHDKMRSSAVSSGSSSTAIPDYIESYATHRGGGDSTAGYIGVFYDLVKAKVFGENEELPKSEFEAKFKEAFPKSHQKLLGFTYGLEMAKYATIDDKEFVRLNREFDPKK